MKICQVLASVGQGGLERHFIELCSELSGDHEVHAVAHESVLKSLPDDVIKHPLDMGGWRYNPFVKKKLKKTVLEINPDVLHAQANKAAALCKSLVKFVRCSVATVHNQKKQIEMFKGYDQVIAVSKEAANPFDNAAVNVIWNGIVPVTEKKPRPKDVPGSYVLSVGRFVEAKGFERLIQSWVDRSETLLIAGDGPDFDNMNAMVSELGLAEKVKLLGFRDDIQALMQNCDALVISSFREGFPYVIVEALHAKCKIMSTTIPGAEDFLPADALVDKESFNTFNAALDYCLSESSAKAFQQSWAKASKYLTLEAMTSETVMVYKKCKPQPTL